jgi:hypothetical protein
VSTRELQTARLLLSLFDEQIAAYEAHHALGRMQRRRAIKLGQYDPTIDTRITGLRQGQTKWSARVAELEKEDEDTSTHG